ITSCPIETQQLLRRTLVAVEWIPLDDWAPFLTQLYERTCRRDEKAYRKFFRAVCKRDFSTVYRVYLSQPEPEIVLNKLSNIWSPYFDSGSLTLAPRSSKEAEIDEESPPTVIALEMRDLETSHQLYAITLQAYLEQLMVMAGATRCTVQRARER